MMIMVAFGGVIGVTIYLAFQGAWWAMVCYVAVVIAVGTAVLHAVQRIEGVEHFGQLFDEAFNNATRGIEPGSDRLGLATRLAGSLEQQGDKWVDHYISEACRLYPRFKSEVLEVLADVATQRGETIFVKSSLKGGVRANEKSRRQYAGNAAKVKDYMRACVFCFTMSEVVHVCETLNELERDGRIKVLQIINGFR